MIPTAQVWRDRRNDAMAAAGIKKWPHDVLRHSFASYHLAHHQHSGQTSQELGHKIPDTVFRHYRNAVTKKAAEKYWNITPN